MDKKQRLIGVDLFRGIAAYAVVIIHAEHEASIPTTWAAKLVQFSGFAVPFFLATSFYLTMNSLYVKQANYSLKSRLIRLLIPYGVWSVIYILQSSTRYMNLNRIDQISLMFQDPVNLIFFGGAAYHLYFLPLLFTGTILVKFTEYLVKKQVKIQPIFLLFILSMFLYQLLLTSENSFQLADGTAFQGFTKSVLPDANKNPLIRILLVELAWMIRCLPYIFLAMILNHPFLRGGIAKLKNRYTIVFFTIFFVVNAFGRSFLPEAIYETARGYFALLLAISLSFDIKDNFIIKNLGSCSFGIYLVHLLVVHGFQSIGKRLYPGSEAVAVTLLPLLILSTVSFLTSWIITFPIVKNKSLSKFIFGVSS